MTSDEFGDIEQLDENLRKWFKEKWVRFGPDGKIRGACARGSDKEGKPKCLPQSKAHSIGKKGRKYAGAKKRREDPNPERSGKAKNVATKKKTNEGVPFDECPKCRGPIVHESMMTEKQDACYHKVKSRYKVWPSAYASGALVQCRKKGASNWGTGGKKDESSIMKGIVDEAVSPAQQAAIAINMKKRGEKPKNEASGTPGGVERFRSPAMVDLAMQQNLYKKDLEAVKKAQQADKPKPEYRKRGPVASGEEHSLHIASTAIPTELVKDWIENRSVSTVVDFMSRRFANRQSTEMIDEIKADPRFSNAVSKFFDIAGKSLKFRIKVKAANTTVNDSKFKVEAEDLRLSGFEALRGITEVVVDYMKKYGVDKTGRRVPPGFNYALGEGVIIGHDKDDPQVAVLGGAGSYKLSNLKKKALGEAKQLAADIANGEYKNSAYNVKQLANTLNTIVAAEEEMEKLYFGEDYTGEFAAEVTPAINPYGGLKDRKHRGMIGETPTDNPTGASGEGGLRKYKPKPAGEIDEDTSYAGGMGQGGNAGESYRKFKPKSAGTFNEEELDEACWKGYHKEGNKKMFGKTYPNCVKNTNEEQIDELSPDLLSRAQQKAHNQKQNIIDKAKSRNIDLGSYGDPKSHPVAKAAFAKDEQERKFSAGARKASERDQDRDALKDLSPAMKRKIGIEEEQLDEKCWDTHKQVGMKNKGGRQVPNCVPKESSIMKGLKSL
jgi:Zn finger protein HypA/HybF involved in hydrogenase expression